LIEPFGGPAGVDVPKLKVTPQEKKWSSEFLSKSGVMAGVTVVGVHPGASIAAKRWPIENFAQVCRELVSRQLAVVSFVEPSGFGQELGEIPGVIAARVTLRQMIALIQRCSLLVCNDSGPMHIAGAVGVSVVAVFGSGISGL